MWWRDDSAAPTCTAAAVRSSSRCAVRRSTTAAAPPAAHGRGRRPVAGRARPVGIPEEPVAAHRACGSDRDPAGRTRLRHPRGHPRLRSALGPWLPRTRGLRAGPDDIVIVSAGAGWLIPPRTRYDNHVAAKHASDLGSPTVSQLVLARLLEKGGMRPSCPVGPRAASGSPQRASRISRRRLAGRFGNGHCRRIARARHTARLGRRRCRGRRRAKRCRRAGASAVLAPQTAGLPGCGLSPDCADRADGRQTDRYMTSRLAMLNHVDNRGSTKPTALALPAALTRAAVVQPRLQQIRDRRSRPCTIAGPGGILTCPSMRWYCRDHRPARRWVLVDAGRLL